MTPRSLYTYLFLCGNIELPVPSSPVKPRYTQKYVPPTDNNFTHPLINTASMLVFLAFFPFVMLNELEVMIVILSIMIALQIR